MEDDRAISLHLREKYPNATIAPEFATSSEAKSFISGLDFLVAGRMHACIGGVSSGVAVVPVAYSRKFIGLFGGLNYNWSIDARATDTTEAISKVFAAFDQLSTLKHQAEASAAKAKSELARYENEVGKILTSISKGR